jgi:hypothetical protein
MMHNQTSNQGSVRPDDTAELVFRYEFAEWFSDHFPLSELILYDGKLNHTYELPQLEEAWAVVTDGLLFSHYQALACFAAPILREKICEPRCKGAYIGQGTFELSLYEALRELDREVGLANLPADPPPSWVARTPKAAPNSPQAGFEDKVYIHRLVSGIFQRVVDAAPRRKRSTRPPPAPRPDNLLFDWVPDYSLVDYWSSVEQVRIVERPDVPSFRSIMDRRKANKAQRKEARKFAYLRRLFIQESMRRPSQLQSGQKPAQPTTREERDEAMRVHAKAQAEAKRKKVPKGERLAAVKQRRDKRNPAFFQSRLQPSVIDSGLYGRFSKVQFAVEPSLPARRAQLQGGKDVLFGAVATVAVSKFIGALGGLFSKVGKVAEAGSDLAKTIKAKFEVAAKEFKKLLGNAIWAVPLVMSAFYALHRLNTQGPIVPMLVIGGLSAVIGPKLWGVCANFFQGSTVRLQSGFDDEQHTKFSDLAGKLFSAVFCFSAFAGKKAYCVSEFMKRMSLLQRCSGGISTFCDWLVKSLEWSMNLIRSWFGKDRVSLMREQHAPLKRWLEDVDKIVEKDVTKGGVTPEALSEMVKAIQLGYEFKEVYRGSKTCRMVEEALSRLQSVLLPYQGALQARNNFRFEPSMLMLYGDPGVGKTLMAMPFCATVLKRSGIIGKEATFDDTVSQIWQKGNSEYWNGYAGQECLVLDDCFQAKADKTDKENEHMTIIRMISSWAFPLNFADLASKGKIYFGSKFVFGTTNLASIDAEARNVIHEPAAVLRRMKYSYKLRVKPDFAYPDGKLNFALFESMRVQCAEENTGIDRFPWQIWEVCKHDFGWGNSDNNWIPVKQLLLQISDDLSKKHLTFTEQKVSLNDYVENMLEPEITLQSGTKDSVERDEACEPHMVRLTGRKRNKELEYCWSDFKRTSDEVYTMSSFLRDFLLGATIWLVLSQAIRFLLGVLGSLFGAFRRRKYATTWEAEMESNLPPKPRAWPVAKPTKNSVSKAVSPKSIKLQGYDEAVATNVYGNTYKIIARLSTGSGMVIGQLQFIQDKLAIQPVHFTRDVERMLLEGSLEQGQCLILRNSMNPQFELNISAAEYLNMKRYTLESAEVEFIEFTACRAHRNIVSNYVKENDIKYVGGHAVRLDVCSVEQRGVVVPSNTRKVFVSNHLLVGKKLKVAGRSVERYFEYQAATVNGDCGAPLCVLNPSRFSGRVCLGFHFAGTSDGAYGYSTIVTQEMIETAMKKLTVVKDNFEQDLSGRGVQLHSSHELPFDVSGSFLPLYVVDKPANISPKSAYFVTSEFGCVGEYKCRPAHLGPVKRGDTWVYPMCNAVLPYSTKLLHYEQPWLEQAVYTALKPFRELTKGRDRRIYTFEEAVAGIAEEKFRSIPRATSPGYPYTLEFKNGKKEFFGDGQDYDFTSSACAELKARTETVIDSAKQGTRLSHVFLDILKDELRSDEKVEAVATRLISAAPVDYSLCFRQYFGAFSAAAMSVPIKCGMAPGINCFGDWDALGTKLSSKGPDVFDGDFKAFDSSEQPSIHNIILEHINQWYDDGPENALVRKVLWLELTHSRHIGGKGFDQKHVYQWNKSLPSGHPFTTIVNSIYSLTLLVGAYISRTGDHSGFWSNVSAVTYGDDNVVNVASEWKDVYNQQTVSFSLDKEFGVKYTPGDKGSVFHDTMLLSEVTFLKRRFREERGRWLCPLELDSFLYTAYWCKNGKLMKKIIIDDWENALEELSMQEPRLWGEYANKIFGRLAYHGADSRYIPRRECYLDAVLRRTDEWY